ncbi:hypothetical protein CWI38_0702p0020 [Hamiltosporidium tvaerminnensis]|uniref:Uncharacterized protein n=2 Tax=Hamiltosporidium TaxID=1176354 RepID=A0A4Q9L8H8_9MICR|nr:hypothetical protein LUQ84_001866 [Hamiltosporidium tvaerminnensis]TBU01578.1 hypothetical protein CWI37_0676p0020 [Hamiltosporidium tvaerminnensis]TBU03997.1 hypothetical protein CWI39_0871p0010 [Hamiltosporidium magnivora]TBU06882.1 hypothetical protein CWI36_0365p0050 [Hamiltosporidium magnivora]TBU12594.1 hypothetical protein CWI38_0702p0020 [Hamiltosporidium tvaerminnensis]
MDIDTNYYKCLLNLVKNDENKKELKSLIETLLETKTEKYILNNNLDFKKVGKWLRVNYKGENTLCRIVGCSDNKYIALFEDTTDFVVLDESRKEKKQKEWNLFKNQHL